MTAILVDDELGAITNFQKLIGIYCPKIQIIATADSAEQAAALINKLLPEVVFLDISMPDKNGFELLNMLQVIPLIVFVTAHEHFALRAIKASAVDFLLKPVDVNELIKVEAKLENILLRKTSGIGESYNSIVSNLVGMLYNQSEIKKLTLHDLDGYKTVDIDKILYLEGDDNYTSFFIHNNGKHVVSKTLKGYEDLLNDMGFVRIHKSTIINMRHLKKVQKDNGVDVVMSDGKALPVSRRRVQELLEKAKIYIS
jgi:two-component system LytT family response regulator